MRDRLAQGRAAPPRDLRRRRNPEEGLPTDFEDNRDVHYENLRQPLDASVFIATLKEVMRASMAACGEVISKNKSGGAKVKTHRGEPRWHIPDLGKLKVPENLRALHTEVAARWGIIDLLDFLKESDFVTDFTDAFTTVATREATSREVIRKRLLLVLYALGTNVGIKRVADGGRHGETEAALRAIRHLFVNRDNLRKAIVTLVNATFATDPLRAHWGLTGAGVVLGLVWAIWHLIPYLQAGHGPAWIAGQVLFTVALRVIIAGDGRRLCHPEIACRLHGGRVKCVRPCAPGRSGRRDATWRRRRSPPAGSCG
ncbi:Tn3 family transposase [Planomonospora corallina]|uniref:Tn3 family transposase n=1 Tax=Planomonospora corallina TaxID=1806052 RepID=A0ABV8IBY5_9ACTN